MAKIECELKGDFNSILRQIDGAVKARVSASEEGRSDFVSSDGRYAVRVYERYSFTGKNRVSMNVTLLKSGERIFLSVITSGGSQAVFFKVNTMGEKSFLECIREVAEKNK